GASANRTITDNNGKTPIQYALQKYNSSCFKPIINALGINGQDSNRRTLLHQAILEGKIDLANQLIMAGANVNTKDNNNYTPLHEAAFRCHSSIVPQLITSGANINAQDSSGDAA